MDYGRNRNCLWVKGPIEDLDRAVLRKTFSPYGNITKIFIDVAKVFAKVYFEKPESVQQAVRELVGYKNYKIGASQGEVNSFTGSNNFTPEFDRVSHSSANSSIQMEETCFSAGNYVDAHGRSVEVLQADNGQLFVNLDDVRKAGFNIYSKDTFENTIISKDIEIREFENYLLNQGKSYLLKYKKSFNEQEVLNIFERVRLKLQGSSDGSFNQERAVRSEGKNNFSISTKNYSPHQPGQIFTPFSESTQKINKRSPQQLPSNLKPSIHHNHHQASNDNLQQLRKPKSETNEKFANNSKFRKAQNSIESDNSLNNFEQKKSPFFDRGAKPKSQEPTIQVKASEENWEENVTSSEQKNACQEIGNGKLSDRNSIIVDRVKLTTNCAHKINVTHMHYEKNNLFYGNNNLELVNDILLHVNEKDCNLPEINDPIKNMLCIAFFEDCWYRAVVVNSKGPDQVLIELMDYGNREIVNKPIKEMSQEMKKIPAQAIRFTISTSDEKALPVLSINQDIEVYVKKQVTSPYDDLTHVVQINQTNITQPQNKQLLHPEDGNQTEKSKNASEYYFKELSASTVQLVPQESVLVVNHIENKLILRNKETSFICKSIYQHINDLQVKGQLSPVNEPKIDQLVLSRKDTHDGLHRVVIRELDATTAKVEFVDYYGTDTFGLKSLRNVDDVLASFPKAAIEYDFPILARSNEESDNFLNNLIFEKKKLRTAMINDKLELLLITSDTSISLSDKLKELIEGQVLKEPEPAAMTLNSNNKEEARRDAITEDFTFDDMPYVCPKPGLDKYMCYCCTGSSVTLVSLSETNIPYLAKLEIVEPTDNTPYTPSSYSMCLAKYKETWYRAVAMEITADEVEVLFVDYGNTEIINIAEIRRFPKSLADVPVLGINADLTGIPPEKLKNEKVTNRLKELIPDETVLDVDFKLVDSDSLKFEIEIPSIYASLRKEGLI